MSIDGSHTDPDAESSARQRTIAIDGPGLFKKPAELKRLGGSQSDVWNNVILNQTVDALHAARTDEGVECTPSLGQKNGDSSPF
jgi:hypothetical protein